MCCACTMDSCCATLRVRLRLIGREEGPLNQANPPMLIDSNRHDTPQEAASKEKERRKKAATQTGSDTTTTTGEGSASAPAAPSKQSQPSSIVQPNKTTAVSPVSSQRAAAMMRRSPSSPRAAVLLLAILVFVAGICRAFVAPSPAAQQQQRPQQQRRVATGMAASVGPGRIATVEGRERSSFRMRCVDQSGADWINRCGLCCCAQLTPSGHRTQTRTKQCWGSGQWARRRRGDQASEGALMRHFAFSSLFPDPPTATTTGEEHPGPGERQGVGHQAGAHLPHGVPLQGHARGRESACVCMRVNEWMNE